LPVLHEYRCPDGILSLWAINDLNGDSRPELVATEDSQEEVRISLCVLDSHLEPIGRFDCGVTTPRSISNVIVSDLDGNGDNEIILYQEGVTKVIGIDAPTPAATH
jgi:hypothetical protein